MVKMQNVEAEEMRLFGLAGRCLSSTSRFFGLGLF